MMKGGARLTLDLEGWCAIETWPWRVVRDLDLTLKGGVRLHMTLMKGRCRSDWDLTLKGGVRLQITLMKGRCRSDWDLTLKGAAWLRLDLEGWCAIETWPWRLVCDWDLTLMKGGCRSHFFVVGARCLSAGRTWDSRVDQQGFEPPPAVCQRWQDQRHTNWAIGSPGWLQIALQRLHERGGSRSTKPCFSCQGGCSRRERYLVCARRVQLRSLCARIVPPMCFATSGCVCVRSSMRFLNLGCRLNWNGCFIIVNLGPSQLSVHLWTSTWDRPSSSFDVATCVDFFFRPTPSWLPPGCYTRSIAAKRWIAIIMQGCLLVDSHKSTGSGPVHSPVSGPLKKNKNHTPKNTSNQANKNTQNHNQTKTNKKHREEGSLPAMGITCTMTSCVS